MFEVHLEWRKQRRTLLGWIDLLLGLSPRTGGDNDGANKNCRKSQAHVLFL